MSSQAHSDNGLSIFSKSRMSQVSHFEPTGQVENEDADYETSPLIPNNRRNKTVNILFLLSIINSCIMHYVNEISVNYIYLIEFLFL